MFQEGKPGSEDVSFSADREGEKNRSNTQPEFGGVADNSPKSSTASTERSPATTTQEGFASPDFNARIDKRMATETAAEHDRNLTTDPIEFFDSLTAEAQGKQKEPAAAMVTVDVVAALRNGDTSRAEAYLGDLMEETFERMQTLKNILKEREGDLKGEDEIKHQRWDSIKITLDTHEDRLFRGENDPMGRHFIHVAREHAESANLGGLLELRNEIVSAERALARYNRIGDKLSGGGKSEAKAV